MIKIRTNLSLKNIIAYKDVIFMDITKMKANVILTEKNGSIIIMGTPEPKYVETWA